jgi:hypothetical protein
MLWLVVKKNHTGYLTVDCASEEFNPLHWRIMRMGEKTLAQIKAEVEGKPLPVNPRYALEERSA